MFEKQWRLTSPEQQEQLGALFGERVSTGLVIFLQGELGAGKTTFARGFLRGLGYRGKVKSPTYSLVEEYPLPNRHCYHLDLYRLCDPEELEYLGMRDFSRISDILLIEWPEKGTGFLPEADLLVSIVYEGENRVLTFQSQNQQGNSLLKQTDLSIT